MNFANTNGNGGTGLMDEERGEVPLDEVLTSQVMTDQEDNEEKRLRDLKLSNNGSPLLRDYKDGKQKVETSKIAAQKILEMENGLPNKDEYPAYTYPGFIASEPDITHKWIGILYRDVIGLKPKYLCSIAESTGGWNLDTIGYYYGPGDYIIQIAGRGPQVRMSIDTARVNQLRRIWGDGWKSVSGDEKPEEIKKDTSTDFLLKFMQDQLAQNNKLVLEMIGAKGNAPSGASGSDLMDLYQKGYTAGRDSLLMHISLLEKRIEELINERDEARDEIDELRYGTNNSDVPAPPPAIVERQKSQTVMDQVKEGTEALVDVINKLKESGIFGEPKNGQDPEIPKVMKAEHLQKVLINAFRQQMPVIQAAQNAAYVINKLEMGVKMIVQAAISTNSASEVVKMLAQYNMIPDATPEMLDYLTKVIEQIKK